MQYIIYKSELIYYITIGGYAMKNNVKIAHIKAELTQKELADEMGIIRQTVSLIKKGKKQKKSKENKITLTLTLFMILSVHFR